MHVLRQILWFKVALVLAVIFFVGFIIVFAFGIGTVAEADEASQSASHILQSLSKVQQASDAAVNESRMALVADIDNGTLVAQLRDVALQLADQLLADVGGPNTIQGKNVMALKEAMMHRYFLQDEQLKKAVRENGQLVTDQQTSVNSAKVIFEVELQGSKVRNYELGQLFEKDVARSDFQWRIITWMIIFMVVSILAAIVTMILMLGELRYRKLIADRIKGTMHRTADGHPILTQQDVEELINIIEQGTYAAHHTRSINGIVEPD